MRSDDIAALRQTLDRPEDNFDKLVDRAAHARLYRGRGPAQELRDAGNAIERTINDNMTWLADADAQKLTMALLTMRHYEAEYRLDPSDSTTSNSSTRHKTFTETFANIDGTPEMKQKLETEVKHYAELFERWIAASDRAYPLRAMIDIDSQSMLPRADEIIAVGQQRGRARVREALTASQARTRIGIIASASPW